MEKEKKKKMRSLKGRCRYFSAAIAIMLTLFTFYTAINGVFVPLVQRGVHLCGILSLVFLWYVPNQKSSIFYPGYVDICLSISSLLIMIYLLLNHQRYEMRIAFFSEKTTMDIIIGFVMIFLVMEAVRRTLGWIMNIISGIFIIYALIGPYLPGILMHKGMTVSKIVEQMFMTTDGLFGSLTGTAATTLFCFVAFGTFLQLTNANQYYMDICLAIAGKSKGGPAKVAVLSSALFGSVSGSTIANVVTTGSLTIPLMKKNGYTATQAAAIETAASAGGQIMPPLMGVSVFIMAEIIGMKYRDIVAISWLPALLFYFSVWVIVDKIARRDHIMVDDKVEFPELKNSVIKGIPLFIPIFGLIYLLVCNYTPFLSGFICTALLAVIALFRNETRYRFKDFLLALEKCSVRMCSITATIACAAVMVAIINKTGLVMKMTSIILGIAGESWVINLILVAVMAYILGMPLPVSTSYVVLAAIGASALVKIGIPMLVAHMTILWFTQLATITPPICMTAFAAAEIADSPPMQTGNTALRYGFAFYYIPLMFVYSELLTGTIQIRIAISICMLAAIILLISGVEGYFFKRLHTLERIICVAASVCMTLCAVFLDSIVICVLLITITIIIVGFLTIKNLTGEKKK